MNQHYEGNIDLNQTFIWSGAEAGLDNLDLNSKERSGILNRWHAANKKSAEKAKLKDDSNPSATDDRLFLASH